MVDKKKRIVVLIAGVAIQLCLGVAYIWSVFQSGIAQTIFAGNNAKASLTYSLLLAVLTVGSVLGGKLVNKIPLKLVVMLGGIILSLGFFIASFTKPEHSFTLWLSYGVMGGIGMGLAYSTTISCVQKWFPDKKGLVTGIIVAALGLGGVIFTPIVEALIAHFGGSGVGELYTFRVIALIFFIVCVPCSLFLEVPKVSTTLVSASTKCLDVTPKQLITRPSFYFLTLSLMLACMGGLMMIGFAKPIAVGRGLGEKSAIAVLLISIFNSIGRLTWGAVSDKLGYVKTIVIMMIGSSLMSVLVLFAKGYSIFVFIGLIGFFYGGLLSTFPSYTAKIYGVKNVATNYGMVLLGFGIGAIMSSYIAGYFKDKAVNDINLMSPAFYIAATCSIVAIAFILLVQKLETAKSKQTTDVIDEVNTIQNNVKTTSVMASDGE